MEIGPACKSHSSTRTFFSASVARICATNRAVVVAPLPGFAGWNANTGAFFLPLPDSSAWKIAARNSSGLQGMGHTEKPPKAVSKMSARLQAGRYAQNGGGRLNASDVVFHGVRGGFIVDAQKHQLRRERIQQSHAFVGLRITLQRCERHRRLASASTVAVIAMWFRGPCRRSVPSAFESELHLDRCHPVPRVSSNLGASGKNPE